ncbi:Alpha/Beta hydrolase protein [Hyaloscypha sp. PMI_1271]|nr:Alpha/Beta hydrolase protein [Hyaloscypha sp. PMI_1271]
MFCSKHCPRFKSEFQPGFHALYCGIETGVPIIHLHGGPGEGTVDSDRQYSDPTHYRSTLFDQRGSGKSLPSAYLDGNTTWTLVADIEALRKHLKVEKWVVFGGSWDSTLSLAYSQKHTEHCIGLILRGIFTLCREELEWFYQKGTDRLFPDYFEPYKTCIPEPERSNAMMRSTWESSTVELIVNREYIKKAENPKWALAFARIECHFFINARWMRDRQLIEEAYKVRHLSIIIVPGRYDVFCPAKTSWDLYQALGGKENSNVGARKNKIQGALVDAAEKFKALKMYRGNLN